jgi:hypothetical protein
VFGYVWYAGPLIFHPLLLVFGKILAAGENIKEGNNFNPCAGKNLSFCAFHSFFIK